MTTLVNVVEKKCALAVALAHEHIPGADYTDANLIVAALVSGMAADLWPGEDGIDRKRFLELWAREADPIFHANLISVPLLYAELQRRVVLDPAKPDVAANEAAAALRTTRPDLLEIEKARVVAGHEVDMNEDEVAKLCPTLSRKDIRDFSYPGVYYEQVRCAASHEYRLGAGATAYPMRRDADVSYSNRGTAGRPPVRLIYFDILWLWRVVRSIAARVGNQVDFGMRRERPEPWWASG